MSDTIRIAIDRVVLHGFEGVDRAGVSASLRQELSRLMSEQGTAFERDAGAARPPGNTAMDQTAHGRLGIEIARATYDRIAR